MPTIKLTGRLTVLFIIRFTVDFLELFCIPIIKSKNSEKLKVNMNKNFFIRNKVFKID